MSGPGDVIAGLAPPQDNAPARNPQGWPYRQARQDEAGEAAPGEEREGGRRRRRRGAAAAGGAEEAAERGLRAAAPGRPYETVLERAGDGAPGAGAGRGGRAAEDAADADGGRGTGDGGSGSGAEGAQGVQERERGSLNALAGYIRASWARNKRARDVVENRLLACLRARRGVYSQAELAEMWTADAGEPIYLPLAATKMRAAEAALRELLLPDGERPWGLDATPIPDLPPEIAAPIEEQAALMARQQMKQMVARDGRVVALDQFTALAARLQAALRDRVLEESRREAKSRAGRMEDVIEERMERGGYYKALAEYVQHFCTYPAAVLKGPFLRRGKRLQWLRPGEPDVVSRPELCWTAVSPFDCYPAPEAESCQDGDFIERIRMTRADLYECIGTPGYSAGSGLTLSGSQFSLSVPVTVANGGTGGTTAVAARAGLGAAGVYAATIGDGATLSFSVTHNLNNSYPDVALYLISSGERIEADVVAAGANAVTVSSAVAFPNNGVKAVVLG